MGFALGIFPVLSVIGIWKLRKTHPEALKVKGFPIPQIIYITAGLMILSLSFMESPLESSIAILTVLVGIPAYYFFKRSSNSGKENPPVN
jgi:APA family basic amino acid/polyamine antiporter